MTSSHKLEGNRLVVEFDPNSTTLSGSGKTFMLASSGGFVWFGDVGVNYNIVRKKK